MASKLNIEKVRREKPLEERYNPRPLILIALILAIIGFFFFISHQYYSLSKPIDGSVWGEFGDFIGGVIGTIIAYISIRLLVATLNTQSIGNAITKETADLSTYELKLQQLNANFKMMLDLYRETLEKFNADVANQGNITGLKFLKQKKNTIFDNFDSSEDSYQARNREAIKLFDEFYTENRPVASVYFRIIYRMMELIFEANINSKDKAMFAKMLRCQLSEEELFFIRYNAMTNNGVNMRKYLNQYNILKHLPELSLLEFKTHLKNGLTSKDKNQMISALIDLRKILLKRDKYAPNEPIKPIYRGYSIECKMNEERLSYKFTLVRTAVNNANNANNESFDKLNLQELFAFMKDFIIELFSFYNFCEYQKAEDINVEANSISENGQDKITITVTSVNPLKKLYMYIDKDPQTSEEYDI